MLVSKTRLRYLGLASSSSLMDIFSVPETSSSSKKSGTILVQSASVSRTTITSVRAELVDTARDVGSSFTTTSSGSQVRKTTIPITVKPGLAKSKATKSAPDLKPAVFEPLIAILRTSRRNGMPKLKRGIVADQLRRANPTVFQDAGVESFRDYINLAVAQRLVTLHSNPGQSQDAISLA